MKVLLNSIPEQTKELMKASKETQRLEWFTDEASRLNWHFNTFFEDDERIIYCEKLYTPRMANQIFPFCKNKRGFSYDKKKKKVQMWWGSSLQKFERINDFLKEIDALQLTGVLEPYVTPKVLGKIISKEIRTDEELVKAIIKTQRYKLSSEAFLGLTKTFYKPQIAVIDKAFFNLEGVNDKQLFEKAKNVLAMSERLDYQDTVKYKETLDSLKLILALDGKKLYSEYSDLMF